MLPSRVLGLPLPSRALGLSLPGRVLGLPSRVQARCWRLVGKYCQSAAARDLHACFDTPRDCRLNAPTAQPSATTQAPMVVAAATTLAALVLPTQATAVQPNGSAPSKKRKFKGPKQGAQATRRHVRLRVDEGGCAACHVALATAAEVGITKGRHTYCEAHGIELLGAKRPRKSQAKPKPK